MPRLSAPFYRPERDQWYVRHNGRRVSLNVRGAKAQTAAERAFRDLLAGRLPQSPPPEAAPPPAPPPAAPEPAVGPTLTVGRLLADYVEAKARTAAQITARSYQWRSNGLCLAVGADTPVAGLTPAAVEEAVARDGWSASYRGDLINLARMSTRWAFTNRRIPSDPLAGLKRPGGPGRRADVRLGPDDVARLLAHCGPDLRGLVAFLYATGARPCEAREVTAADFDGGRGVIVLRAHKTAGKTGEPRVIVVPAGDARAALAEAAGRFPSGPLFRRPNGEPWTRTTLSHAFRRARETAKLPEVLTPYTIRHLFCTDALTRGVPDATVAALVGHKSTRMLHAHYSHLLSRVDALAKAVESVRGNPAGPGAL